MTAVVLAAFATMKLVDLGKELVPWAPPPWQRSTAAIVVAGIISAWWSNSIHHWGLNTLAAAGVASVLHEVQAVLALVCDESKTRIILRAGNRRRIP